MFRREHEIIFTTDMSEERFRRQYSQARVRLGNTPAEQRLEAISLTFNGRFEGPRNFENSRATPHPKAALIGPVYENTYQEGYRWRSLGYKSAESQRTLWVLSSSYVPGRIILEVSESLELTRAKDGQKDPKLNLFIWKEALWDDDRSGKLDHFLRQGVSMLELSVRRGLHSRSASSNAIQASSDSAKIAQT